MNHDFVVRTDNLHLMRWTGFRTFFNTQFLCFFIFSSINQTDQMLVHLQAFNSLPENYMIPESTKNGVPLFYIPPGSTTPVRRLAVITHMIYTPPHQGMHF